VYYKIIPAISTALRINALEKKKLSYFLFFLLILLISLWKACEVLVLLCNFNQLANRSTSSLEKYTQTPTYMV